MAHNLGEGAVWVNDVNNIRYSTTCTVCEQPCVVKLYGMSLPIFCDECQESLTEKEKNQWIVLYELRS